MTTLRHYLCLCSTFLLLSAKLVDAQLPAPVLPLSQEPLQQNGTGGRTGLIFSEAFLNQLVTRETVEQGPVNDFILGAKVIGTQSTSARTSLNLIAEKNSARFVVNLHGTTQNQTTSLTPRAAVQSQGKYSFELAKLIQFDGRIVSTWSPSATLFVEQRNLGAITRLAPVPLLGPVANQAALNVANQRRPEAERIAAWKVTQNVAPRFNDEIDRQIKTINQTITQFRQNWLNTERLQALQFSADTTERHLTISATVGTPTHLVTSQKTADLPPEVDVAFFLDADFVNGITELLPLSGLRVTDTQLKAAVEKGLSELSTAAPPQFITILLDETKPLQYSFRNSGIEIETRLAIQPVLGERIPLHRFVLRLTPVLQPDSIQLIPTVVDLQQLANDPQASSANLTREIIETKLQEELKSRSLPRSFTIPAFGEFQATRVSVVSLIIVDSQLQINLDVAPLRRQP